MSKLILPQPFDRHLLVGRSACYIVVVTAVSIYALMVGATLWEYCCLLMASEGMLATTRVVCGVFPVFHDRGFPLLTVANLIWIFISCWIALGTIFLGRLPLLPTVYVLAFIAIPELCVQLRNPDSDLYRRSLADKRQPRSSTGS